MSSQVRINASRRNARNSTGPRTPEGKAAVRFNSLTHGAFAAEMLLPGEDAEAFRALESNFRQLYHPSNETEVHLVNRMILSSWRLLRLAGMETRVLRLQADLGAGATEFTDSLRTLWRGEDEPGDSGAASPPTRDPIALAWIRDSNGGNTLARLLRHQNSMERSFYRALHLLRSLREQAADPPR